MYFFCKFDVFHGKNGCDCEDKTYVNCYVLKYLEIVLPDPLNPLKHICTTTNYTTIGTFTLMYLWVNVEINNHNYDFKYMNETKK